MLGRRGGLTRRVWLGVCVLTAVTALAVSPGALAQSSSTTEPSTTVPSTSAPTSVAVTSPPATVTMPPPSVVVIPPSTSPPRVATDPPPSGAPPSTVAEARTAGPPPPSVSDAEVSSWLTSLERSPGSSNLALLEALRALEPFGFSPQEAAMIGSGRFPLAGEAYFRDDFGEPRSGPPPHPHEGNDIWAAFDTPVRSPADGVIRFEDSGLGGKGAFVTEPDGTYYYLAHLNGFAPDLADGDAVRMGQLIGFNGDSGNARGGPPHVHFEIHPKGGPAINPKPILDRWLAEALAAVPALLAPLKQTTSASRPLSAMGLSRYFDRTLTSGPDRPAADPDTLGGPSPMASQFLADALVAPLTPPVLRASDPTALR